MKIVTSLPTENENYFIGARAVTSPSGRGAIVQYQIFLYELKCKDGKKEFFYFQKIANQSNIQQSASSSGTQAKVSVEKANPSPQVIG